MKIEYPFQVVWSPEDEAYLAVTVQLPGCMADGKTPEEAITNLRQVIDEWVQVAKDDGREVPPPMTVVELQKEQAKADQQLRQYVDNAVNEAVQQVLNHLASSTIHQHFAHYRGVGFLHPGLEPAGSGRR